MGRGGGGEGRGRFLHGFLKAPARKVGVSGDCEFYTRAVRRPEMRKTVEGAGSGSGDEDQTMLSLR